MVSKNLSDLRRERRRPVQRQVTANTAPIVAETAESGSHAKIGSGFINFWEKPTATKAFAVATGAPVQHLGAR